MESIKNSSQQFTTNLRILADSFDVFSAQVEQELTTLNNQTKYLQEQNDKYYQAFSMIRDALNTLDLPSN